MDMSRLCNEMVIDEDNLVVVADAGCSVYWSCGNSIGKDFASIYAFVYRRSNWFRCFMQHYGNYMTRYGSMGDNLLA
jgi:hypothetical protein